MKVHIKHVLNVLLPLVLGGGALLAQPETADLRGPEAIQIVEPVVPYDFARYQITGEVQVTFRIDEDGRPREIEVESATHREYGESVENALRQWRFEEPEVAGRKYRLPVLFN